MALILFAANSLIHGPPRRAADDQIEISEGRVLQIADNYRLLSGRMPSRAELQGLVNDFIDEEISYREALALGLDADDTIVRRRMRQKLEFMAEDADASEEPSDQQLMERLRSHSKLYRLPERRSLRHILASGDARGTKVSADAAAFLDKLTSGAEANQLGDTSMLPSMLPLTTRQGVAMLFGEAFATRVFTHEGDDWFGPVDSPFGSHVVQILSRQPATDPTLDEVRDQLRSDWIEARRRAQRTEFHTRLRQRYRVSVDWPEPYTQPLDTIDMHGE